MKLALYGVMFAAASLVVVTPLRSAGAAEIVAEPVTGYFGEATVTPDGVAPRPDHGSTLVLTTAYDNTTAPAAPNFGVSSTDLTSQWGDEVLTTLAGPLSTHKFTIFNGSAAGLTLLTATVNVAFFDAVTAAPLGAYTTSINFGAGLPSGFFSIVTVTGIDPLNINLPTDVIIVQSVTAATGTANRLGVASMNPPTIGSSPTSMFIASSTIGGGVPGFYTFPNGPANPGYQIVVNEPVVPSDAMSWGRLKGLYR